jgi:anti-sigma regulatory factor (Ser/Thr protein kinase)
MPDSPKPVIDLAIRNDLAQLSIVTDMLDRLGRQRAIPARALMQVQVALDEMLSNIIKYAWPDGGVHEVQLRIRVQDEKIDISIVDDGRPFDPRRQPVPAPPRPGHEPRTGGVGIHMTRQLVDRIDYARIDGRNRVTLVKEYASDKGSRQDRP